MIHDAKFKIAVALTLFMLLFVNSPSPGQSYLKGKRQAEPVKHFDILHYKLDLRFSPFEKQVTGSVGIRFVPTCDTLTTVILDAAKMEIHDIRAANHDSLRWQKTPDKLHLQFARALQQSDTTTVIIRYTVRDPETGLFFNLPDSTGAQQYIEFYSQGEMEDNHYWFPCWDYPNDRATSEMIATVPIPLRVISNGKLLSVQTNSDSTRTFHFLMNRPHVSYLISVVGGDYARVVDWFGNIPVEYYVHDKDTVNVRLSLGKTPKMLQFFSTQLDFPYPYSKYAQTLVHNFRYGGMENITATTLNYSSLKDRRSLIDSSPEGLVAHELAHQWFGDMVTLRTWDHVWLNEGFATYFASLWTEYEHGWAQMQYNLANEMNSYFMEDNAVHRRALVWSQYDNPEVVFDRHAYQKGARVLHMLRYELGDSLFWKGIRHYLKRFAWQCVVTEDLQSALEEATGKDLSVFFKQWVYGAGYPELTVKKRYDADNGQLILTVLQTQEKDSLCGTFEFPVDIEIATDNAIQSYRVYVNADSNSFAFPCPTAPRMVLFDKGHYLLKTLEFPKEQNEWVYQLQHDSDALGRLDAARELGKLDLNEMAVQALSERFRHEPTFFVRREILRTLEKKAPDTLTAIMPLALHDPSSKVRTAALRVFEDTPDLISGAFDTLLAIYRADSSYMVQREVLNACVAIDSARAIDLLREALHTDSFNETIRLGALNAIRKLKNPEFITEVLPFVKRPYPDPLRYQALLTLTRLDDHDPRVRQQLLAHLNDPYRMIRRLCASTLNRLADSTTLPALKNALQNEKDDSIRKILERGIKKIEKEASQ